MISFLAKTSNFLHGKVSVSICEDGKQDGLIFTFPFKLAKPDSIMTEFNPYAAPDFKGELTQFGEIDDAPYVSNSCLVIHKGTDLPDICVYSGNIGGNVYVKKKFAHAPSWVLIVFLLNALLGLIVYFVLRKTAKVGFYIASEVKSSRRKLVLINWLIFLGSLVSIPLAIYFDRMEIIIALPVLMVVSLIFYFVKIRGLYAGWIDRTSIGIKGIRYPIMSQMVEAKQV